mgnify:CR=1 FL=1
MLPGGLPHALGEGLEPQESDFAAEVAASFLNAVRFGSEGQYWARMAPQVFLAADDAPPPLQARLRDCLNALRR